MKTFPIRFATAAASGILLVAGCGGGGTNPPAVNAEVPETLTFPAYHTTGPDGEELYLLLKKDGNTLKGEFMYFIPNSEDTNIMSGPANGSVEADGTVHLTLTNPYDSTVPPIETEGVQTATGWRLHDVETPETVVEFTPVAQPTATPLSRGILGNTAKINIKDLNQQVVIEHNVIPWALTPLAYNAEIKSANKSTWSFPVSRQDHEEAYSSVWVCSWIGTSWTWVDVYRSHNGTNTHTARLWVMVTPNELDTYTRDVSSDSAIRAFNGQWVKVKATIGPEVDKF